MSTDQISLFAADPSDALSRLLATVGAQRKAPELLRRFGSLGAILAAAPATLRAEGLAEDAVSFVGLVQEAAALVSSERIARRDVMSNWTVALEYLKSKLQHEPREVFHVLFLDSRNQLITDERMGVGTINHAPVYPREVVRRALELSAAAIILSHNHPSGDPTPSGADIQMTREVVDACRALKITVHDHVVIGRDGTASFRALGLFN
jgi:DNA repair protein RadC